MRRVGKEGSFFLRPELIPCPSHSLKGPQCPGTDGGHSHSGMSDFIFQSRLSYPVHSLFTAMVLSLRSSQCPAKDTALLSLVTAGMSPLGLGLAHCHHRVWWNLLGTWWQTAAVKLGSTAHCVPWQSDPPGLYRAHLVLPHLQSLFSSLGI